jgi:hypothetical protein
MRALAFWKAVAMDQSHFLDGAIALLAEHGIRYCVVGGHAVNAYVEPVVTLDLDLAIAIEELPRARDLLGREFRIEAAAHSLNVSATGSDLRVQIQTDPRYSEFPARATLRDVLGLSLPVASLEDVLRGKVWAATDTARRPSKRQKDLADISRILESYPHLRDRVPPEILAKLV